MSFDPQHFQIPNPVRIPSLIGKQWASVMPGIELFKAQLVQNLLVESFDISLYSHQVDVSIIPGGVSGLPDQRPILLSLLQYQPFATSIYFQLSYEGDGSAFITPTTEAPDQWEPIYWACLFAAAIDVGALGYEGFTTPTKYLGLPAETYYGAFATYGKGEGWDPATAQAIADNLYILIHAVYYFN